MGLPPTDTCGLRRGRLGAVALPELRLARLRLPGPGRLRDPVQGRQALPGQGLPVRAGPDLAARPEPKPARVAPAHRRARVWGHPLRQVAARVPPAQPLQANLAAADALHSAG
ncbi:MAG: hypothetical protein ACM3XM_14470 [Mycobacterium leprae]